MRLLRLLQPNVRGVIGLARIAEGVPEGWRCGRLHRRARAVLPVPVPHRQLDGIAAAGVKIEIRGGDVIAGRLARQVDQMGVGS